VRFSWFKNGISYALFGIVLSSTAYGDCDHKILSEALGHILGRYLQSSDVVLDLPAITKGIEKEVAGVSSPLSDSDCIHMLLMLQKKSNFAKAANFLKENKEKDEVTELIKDVLQFKTVKKGSGDSVEIYHSPLIRLKKLNNTYEESEIEEIVVLNEMIEGLKLGILGMHEGETRILYIHPSIGYETWEPPVHPSSCLVFEVEILKTDASLEAHSASSPPLPFFTY